MTRARGRYFNDDRFGRWGMNDGWGGHMPLRFVTMDHGGNSFRLYFKCRLGLAMTFWARL